MKNALQFVLVALLVLAGTTLFAQPPGGGGGGRMMNPEQRAEQQTAQMTEQLSLSEAQAVKIREINLKYAKQGQEAREKADGDREAMREIFTAIRQEQDKELQTMLTTEQWELWVKTREEMRSKRGNWGGERPPAVKPVDKGDAPKKDEKND